MWERSFVAVSMALGASVDDALARLPAGAEAELGDLAAKLRDPRRAARAGALAGVLQTVAFALDEVTLR